MDRLVGLSTCILKALAVGIRGNSTPFNLSTRKEQKEVGKKL
jgi:hypothetical protein